MKEQIRMSCTSAGGVSEDVSLITRRSEMDEARTNVKTRTSAE